MVAMSMLTPMLLENFCPSTIMNWFAGTSYGRLSPPCPRIMAGHMIVWNTMLSFPRK
jgi:hypothetical protein